FVTNTVSSQVTNNVDVENTAALVANIYKNSIIALKSVTTSSNTAAIQIQLDNLVSQANTDLNALKTAGKATAEELANALAVVAAAQSEVQGVIDSHIPAPTGSLAFATSQPLSVNIGNAGSFTISG